MELATTMSKQRLKRIQAGRLVREVLWTPAYPCDIPRAREAKEKTTSAARAKINSRQRWQKLQLILAANFAGSDWFVTLTYDDEHLPGTRVQAKARLDRFVRELRQVCRARGFDLRYCKCTEGEHGDERLHHHIVLTVEGLTLEDLVSLWPDGNVDYEPLEQWGYAYLAQYMTKEATNGRTRVGEHAYSPSRKLKKPVIEPSQWVSGSVRLEPPAGSHVLLAERLDNEFGRYEYLEYLLPETPKAVKVRPKARPMPEAVSA